MVGLVYFYFLSCWCWPADWVPIIGIWCFFHNAMCSQTWQCVIFISIFSNYSSSLYHKWTTTIIVKWANCYYKVHFIIIILSLLPASWRVLKAQSTISKLRIKIFNHVGWIGVEQLEQDTVGRCSGPVVNN